MSDWQVVRTVERLAAHGLDRDPEAIEIADSDADAYIAEVEKHRLSGVAVLALAEGSATASNEVADRLIALHDEIMGQTLRVEITAIRVSQLLVDAGIDHRLLKGPALAHTIYLDPAVRSFRDVDMLVPSTEIDRTVDLLTSQGAIRAQGELRPGFDRRFGKSVTMKLDGVEVDLHRVLSPGPFGVWMKPDDLFLLPESIMIGGAEIPVLDRTDNLLHGCYHAALGQAEPALSNLRDIALLAGSSNELGFDVERFDQTVDRWQGRAAVARAVRLVTQRLSVELPSELNRYAKLSLSADERAAIEPYLIDGHAGRFGALAPATLRALPLGERPAYALAVGLPEGAEPVDRVKELLNRRRR